MSATEAWRTSLRELNRTKLCERKRRRGERDQAEERKRERASEARACSLVAYRAARLRLKVRLQVQGRVEIAAGVADAAPLDGVHAHRDTAVVVRAHRRRRVREPTLRLGALARAALELPAHLHHHTPAMSAARARAYCPLSIPHTNILYPTYPFYVTLPNNLTLRYSAQQLITRPMPEVSRCRSKFLRVQRFLIRVNLRFHVMYDTGTF